MSVVPETASTSLFKGGPTLIDLLIDVSELRLAVTGPRMLFEKLVVVTTLTALDGATAGRLRELADSLDGTIHCGLVGIQRAAITVAAVRSGAHVEIALGPPSMYQSELVLRTRTGETFRQLLLRLLTQDPTRPFLAGLHPVTATGHLEHHHGPDPHPQPGPEPEPEPDTGGHPGHGNHTGHGGTGGHGEPGGHSGQGA
jgi:hypothetical protein